MSVFISDRDTANDTSSFLDQNNPKSKHQCKNDLIYIRDFEAIPKTRSPVLSGIKTLGKRTAVHYFNNTLLLVF